MDVTDSFDDLFEQDLGQWFVTLLPLAHEVEQVASSTQLHDKHNVALGFECFVELDYRGMAES